MNDTINLILTALTNYFKEADYKKENIPHHPQTRHYYNEIIRYRNRLNFIIKKTLRSIKGNVSLDFYSKACYFYATYRFFWESALVNELSKELRIQNNSPFLSFLRQLKSFSWKKALKGKTDIEQLSIQYSVPTFFINHLLPVMNLELIKENILVMDDLARNNDCTLRLNSLMDPERNEILLSDLELLLNDLRIKYRRDKDIPQLIHVPVQYKPNLIKSRLYNDGSLIFQDKASVTVAKVLDPHPHELVLDICAAPGMKTSLIAQFSNNKSRIIAGEFLYNRALGSKDLLTHLKVLDFHIINTDGILFPARNNHKFDKILLDAPCTGSGTFFANPELKWRQNKRFLHQNIILQEKLFMSALEMLKPHGILVYSTCSLYPEEGELQVIKLLDDLEPLALPVWISPSYPINEKIIPGTGRLFPSHHGSQGFFISKFRKK